MNGCGNDVVLVIFLDLSQQHWAAAAACLIKHGKVLLDRYEGSQTPYQNFCYSPSIPTSNLMGSVEEMTSPAFLSAVTDFQRLVNRAK